MFSNQNDSTSGRLPPGTPLWVIILTCTISLWLNTLPIPLGIYALCPDFLLCTLIFWSVFESTKIGILSAWFLGLFMDVIHGTLLSQHSLCYAFAVFFAIMLKRRLFRFLPLYQSLHIAPITFLGQATVYWISGLRNNEFNYPIHLLLGNLWVIPLWIIGCHCMFRWRRHTLLHTLD